MKTNTKTYTLTVSKLASLQKDTKIYLDEAFQSNTRWTIAMNQAYMKSGSASKYTGNARHMYKAKEIYSRGHR